MTLPEGVMRPSDWFEAGHLSGDPLLDDFLSTVSEAGSDVWHNEDKTQHECWWITVQNDARSTRFYFKSEHAANIWREQFTLRIDALTSAFFTQD
jgi:hypothetical protein